MIKRFCDGCGKHLSTDNERHERDVRDSTDCAYSWTGPEGKLIQVKVMVAVEQVWNAGNVCESCVLKTMQNCIQLLKATPKTTPATPDLNDIMHNLAGAIMHFSKNHHVRVAEIQIAVSPDIYERLHYEYIEKPRPNITFSPYCDPTNWRAYGCPIVWDYRVKRGHVCIYDRRRYHNARRVVRLDAETICFVAPDVRYPESQYDLLKWPEEQ